MFVQFREAAKSAVPTLDGDEDRLECPDLPPVGPVTLKDYAIDVAPVASDEPRANHPR